MKKLYKFGYTLAEIVIVMLIITVIVSVTIKLTKAKLDNIISYTYYTAYDTLFSGTKEVFVNYKKPNDDIFNNSENIIGIKGEDFCENLESYLNTSDGNCEGSSIDAGTNDFSGKTPDMILRTGMRLYNFSGYPQNLSQLNGNSKNKTYKIIEPSGTDAGTCGTIAEEEINGETKTVRTYDIDTCGYTIYVDIDGKSGNSTLYQDVYPFYITLSGSVLPELSGINAEKRKNYIMASAYKQTTTTDGDQKLEWLSKSVYLINAMCKVGYINQNTEYCNGIPQYTCTENGNNCGCDADGVHCGIKIIKPVKLFSN